MRPHSAPRWLLPASLSLNLFLAVAVAAHLRAHHFGPPPSPEHMIEDMAAALPPPDADILRQAFRRHGAGPGDPGQSMRTVHDAIRRALSAPAFDPAALRAAFAAGRRSREAMDTALEDTLVDAAGRMSAAGRRALGDWRPPPPP